jgi:hypothetical protein
MNRIGGVMFNVLASSVVDRRFMSRSGQTKTMQLVCVASLLSTQHYIILIPSQLIFALCFNAVCLAEKLHIPIA